MKRRILLALAGGTLVTAGALTLSMFIAPYPVVPLDSVRAAWRASDAWLLDRHGEPLSRVRVDHQRRRGDWITPAEVSPAFVAAVLAAEDRRFHAHAGVDWPGMIGAFWQTLTGGRRGGSTLTMQVAAAVHPKLARSGARDVLQKWRQMRQALAIERSWRKDEVLEAWLNLTPFRGELEGTDAAARALFGKRAAGLDRSESALLASLVRAPNACLVQVARRACALLALGVDSEECLLIQSMAAQGLRHGPARHAIGGDAPHLARRLLSAPGQRLVSTLDARVQRFAVETLTRHLHELNGRQVEDGALLVLDNPTGEIIAWVGSSGGLSNAGEVDGVTARRQAGSTLKPFLYALAIEKQLLTAASILDDSPLAVTTPAGLYVPQNYDHSFRGSVSLRQSLASSLNVPAVRTVTLVGHEAFYRQLKGLGFDTLDRDAHHYSYALALGGADVTLLQLTNAYRTLANGGWSGAVVTTPTAQTRDDEGEQVMTAQAAFIVGDILADPAARALTFGLASPLATRYAASVKTGTSKDMRDNWAVGYSDRYTVGVWVGNFSGKPMHDVSGVTGAAPVWREVMDFLQQGVEPAQREPPEGLVRQRVVYADGSEPAREEWFVAGTETATVTPVGSMAGRPRIESPANGAIYAVDPDIPRDRQRLTLRARAAARTAARGHWFEFDDGTRLRADAPQLWPPTPGRHEMALVDAQGTEIDRVRFEVRGLRRPGSGLASSR